MNESELNNVLYGPNRLDPTTTREVLQDLVARIRTLEAEVAELRSK